VRSDRIAPRLLMLACVLSGAWLRTARAGSLSLSLIVEGNARLEFAGLDLAQMEEPPPPTTSVPKAGEICVVCNNPVGAHDRAYLIQGQRVAVHAGACDRAFRADPARWLKRVKPLGSFLGTEAAEEALSHAWLYGGLYILLGLLFGALNARRALRASRNPLPGFSLGLFLNIFGYIFWRVRFAKGETVVLLGAAPGRAKLAVTYSPVPCPRCGMNNHPSATYCLSCGAALSPQVTSEVAKLDV